VRDDGLDQASLLKVLQARPGERTVNLQAIDEGGDGDEAVRLNVLVELVGRGLVEHDGMLRLVLDLALGPLHSEIRGQIMVAIISQNAHPASVSHKTNLLLLLLSSGC
jgi:hypothetical protein